jgi:hypothetical protein
MEIGRFYSLHLGLHKYLYKKFTFSDRFRQFHREKIHPRKKAKNGTLFSNFIIACLEISRDFVRHDTSLLIFVRI